MNEQPPALTCTYHPNIETSLRCSTCEKPICPKCAILTPTGYRCKDCVRGQQKVFETALWYDYLSTSFIAVVLSFIGSQFIPRLWFFAIILSPIAGTIIAEICRAVVQKRRSRRLYQTIAFATAFGSLPYLLLTLIASINALAAGSFASLISFALQALYSFLVTSSVYYRLSGIQLRI
ncbi:MAG: hypothetical protein DDG59_13705 [Anaerolineae bacterium]|jgi:hypothetical protein|nr:MAG: hypothetical protein DDG59_13705 [Anaerolineae bacterium]